MQKDDVRIDCDFIRFVDVTTLAFYLRKRYLLTYPIESSIRMLNKGFKIVITNFEY